jgi:hypothetical protein
MRWVREEGWCTSSRPTPGRSPRIRTYVARPGRSPKLPAESASDPRRQRHLKGPRRFAGAERCEPPGADPHAGWCGRGRVKPGPLPDQGNHGVQQAVAGSRARPRARPAWSQPPLHSARGPGLGDLLLERRRSPDVLAGWRLRAASGPLRVPRASPLLSRAPSPWSRAAHRAARRGRRRGRLPP